MSKDIPNNHVEIQKSSERGSARYDWLESRFSFSFANYYNPQKMGYGVLRVLNDDIIAPSMGFDTHPHRNMEIVSVPIYGRLRHRDTMGNDYVIEEGEIQTMSAGRGIAHSEYNDSETEHANFLQIWILPKKKNIDPQYSQKKFSLEQRRNKLQLVVSPDGRNDSAIINQDAFFSLVDLSEKNSLIYEKYEKTNGIYFFVIDGHMKINDIELVRRDGLATSEIDDVVLTSLAQTNLLIIEVPLYKDLT